MAFGSDHPERLDMQLNTWKGKELKLAYVHELGTGRRAAKWVTKERYGEIMKKRRFGVGRGGRVIGY